MITLTLNDIIKIAPILGAFMQIGFPGATTFKIARIVREFNKEIELFENNRKAIIEKYGERDNNGALKKTKDNNIKVQEEKIKECEEEFQLLLMNKIEINAEKIPASIFDKIEITPSEAFVLGPIIDFE